jgi:hypothetical protein
MVVGLAPAKIAVAVGTVAGDQLELVFHSWPGPAQVADWACATEEPRQVPARAHAAIAADLEFTAFLIPAPRIPSLGFTTDGGEQVNYNGSSVDA